MSEYNLNDLEVFFDSYYYINRKYKDVTNERIIEEINNSKGIENPSGLSCLSDPQYCYLKVFEYFMER